jgi:uncharacterized DUF497 family protein
MYEWDEAKRLRTIEKHGIDFAEAIEVFNGEYLILPAHSDNEPRHLAVGMCDGIIIAIVFTIRSDAKRIITARRARENERKQYKEIFAGRNPAHERPH